MTRARATDVVIGGEADQLPERGALGPRAKTAAPAGLASAVTGFRTQAGERDDDQLVLIAEDRASFPSVQVGGRGHANTVSP